MILELFLLAASLPRVRSWSCDPLPAEAGSSYTCEVALNGALRADGWLVITARSGDIHRIGIPKGFRFWSFACGFADPDEIIAIEVAK